MTILHTDHWTWWLGVGGHTWPDGLIAYNRNTGEFSLPKRYFVMQQHSRFIRDHINVAVDAPDLPDCINASAYISPDGSELVVILLNHSTESHKVHLSGIPEGVVPLIFETSEQYDCQSLGVQDVSDGYVLPRRSATNLVFRKV
jgi:hypothetical protein